MDVELIFKISSVGIAVAVINLILGKLGKDEYSSLITVAGVIVILLSLLGELGTLMQTLRNVFRF